MLPFFNNIRSKTQSIKDVSSNMISHESSDKIKKFLMQETAKKSVREVYYQHSNYIAEYFCTLSNIGLFAVALYYSDKETFLAALASAVSHAIPSQRLHDLDMVGVLLLMKKAAFNYDMLISRPDIAAYGAAALAINVADTNLTRRYLNNIGPVIHVIWHFAAAFALHKFNEGLIEHADYSKACIPVTPNSYRL